MIFRLRAARILVTISTFAALTLSGFPSDIFAARVALPTIPGIWCSSEPGRTLSTEQRQLLTRSLGRITGWKEIQFSAYGSLVLGHWLGGVYLRDGSLWRWNEAAQELIAK